MSYKYTTYIKGEPLYTAKKQKTDWTYLKEAGFKQYKSTKRRIITVKCKCGKEKDVQYNNIKTGKSLCCGFDPCRIPHNKSKKSVETSYNSLYYSYKKGAEDRGYCFKLTMPNFKNLTSQKCHYCNIEPSQEYKILNSKTKEVRAGIPIMYNGIDRKDNTKGYTLKNSIPCCGTCNKMKSALSYNDFLLKIKTIHDFLNSTCANIK